MNEIQPLLLVGSVALVGVLHTIVPDHWVPIALLARQQGSTQRQTALASFKAGVGHVVSTLIIALIVWTAGVAFAQRFGHWVETLSSIALIGFGGWIAVSSLLEMHRESGHHHHHHRGSLAGHDDHGHGHDHHDQGEHEHDHHKGTGSRMALLLIVGSSPMVEGIPAFFAASRYGIGLIAVMSLVFAIATIGTYVTLCVYSTKGLQRVTLGPLEKYGEVLSGAFIATVGFVFWIWPSF